MSRSTAWGALIILSGLLVASWWAVNRNATQGLEAVKQKMEDPKGPLAEQSKSLTKIEEDNKRKEAIARLNTKKIAKAMQEKKAVKVKSGTTTVDGPQITPDWFRTRSDGEAGVKAVEKHGPYAGP